MRSVSHGCPVEIAATNPMCLRHSNKLAFHAGQDMKHAFDVAPSPIAGRGILSERQIDEIGWSD